MSWPGGLPPWRFRGRVLEVLDGDTVRVALDLGFRITHVVEIRLLGIDAPELHAPDPGERAAAAVARQALARLVEGREIVVETERDRRSFARYLGRLAVPDGEDWVDVAGALAALGVVQERLR